MNQSWVKHLKKEREKALKIVEACDLMLANHSNGDRQKDVAPGAGGKKRSVSKGFGELIVRVLSENFPNGASVYDVAKYLNENHRDEFKQGKSSTRAKVDAQLRTAHQRGAVYRTREKLGKPWHYKVT